VEETSIKVNKALRRRVKIFGLSRDVIIVLLGVVTLCLVLGTILPVNVATAIFAVLFLTTLFVLKDGIGEVLAKCRKPRHYTRGCFDYHSPLKDNSYEEEKS
jgi:hypothetical protein